MRNSKQVRVGNVLLGGGAPVTVQSMLSVPSTDVAGSVRQALELERAGCEILRAAIPNKEAVALIPESRRKFRSLWWQIFILITGWHWRQRLRESIKSGSIQAILERRAG